jgi:hypothetical protein
MRILSCVIKDMKLAVRNYYVFFSIGFAVIFALLVAFAIPEAPASQAMAYIYLDEKVQLPGELAGEFSNNLHDAELVGSRDEIVSKMEKNRESMGVYITFESGKAVFEYIMQGYESEQMKNIIEAAMNSYFAEKAGMEMKITVTEINPGQPKIPLNKNYIPLFLVMESAFMGYFLAAAYLFIDKEEGTIKAFAVTPGKVWEYLLSKVIVFVLYGWMSGLIVTLAIMGFSVNYLQFGLMLMVYSAVGTILGLILASFFETINAAMIWIIGGMLVLGLSTFSYFAPAFSPWYIKIIPTYHMLFGFKDVLFGTGSTVGIYLNIVVYGAISVLLFLFAERLYHKKLSY